MTKVWRKEKERMDFTMCSSLHCPKYYECYRTQARVSEYQSWSNFEYTCNEISGFEDFIPMDDGK
jgi:hypothetical protein